jgi:hypothetical protein
MSASGMGKQMVSSQHARDQLKEADAAWRSAMRAHEGYVTRIRDLAGAADQESRALTLAQLANIQWQPIPGASNLAPPDDLAKGGDRRGNPALWKKFDQALKNLGTSLEADSMRDIATAYEQLSHVLLEIADNVEITEQAPARNTA